MLKQFALTHDQIKLLAVGYGRCIATDMITVEAKGVGYMYREKPTEDGDSGWCFMSGIESQEYLDIPQNLGIYDVNTIVNYSPDIAELLDSPLGSAFERDQKTGKFVPVSFEPPNSE